MKLPSFFGKKEKKEYFLALLLRDEKVTAVIFEALAGKVRVVGKNESYLATSLDVATPDEWLEAFDNAISRAEETIPENVETQKTIFGVKETWVQDSKIKKEYLLRLKKASDTLGLQPIGFLVIHEAIAHLLQEEEGAPVSGILIEIGQKNITVSLLRAGRIIETKRTASEDDVAKITDRLLHHFTNYEVLPSRILVLSDKTDNEKLSQSFISHTWSKNLPFLHVPQITMLPKNFDAKAVLSGAASQMGFEFLSSSNQQPTTKDSSINSEQILEKGKEETEIKIEEVQPEEEENFGFIKGTDIRINTIKHEETLSLPKTDEKEEALLETTFSEEIMVPTFQNIESEPENKHSSHTKKKSISTFIQLGKSFILNIPKKIISIFSKTTQHEPKKKKLLLILSSFLLMLLGIFALYIFFIKATVTIIVTPKIIEQKQNIIFSTINPTDVEKNNITAEAIEVSKQGKTTRKATGKKEIGTKAKGVITIYNKTSQSKTLPIGTILTTTNDLAFTLDASVTIASASGAADAFSSITPSTAKANVTANTLGKESNLPSGSIFTIKSFTTADLAAKNDAAFSGGTKKEVTVVSKNDVASAIEELTNTLTNGAEEEMKQKIDKESKILPFIISTSFSQSDIDRKVDEEASKFTIAGTVTFEGLSYQESDMQQFIKILLNADIDQDLVLDTTTYELQEIKKSKNNTITSTIQAKAFLLPKLEKEKIAKDIAGTSFNDAKKTIEKIPQIKDVQILLLPNIPFLPMIMPKFSQNIIIVIEKE